MLAVSAADLRLFADLDAVRHKGSLHDGPLGHLGPGHQHAVDDLCARADLYVREEDRVPDRPLDDAALGDEGLVDLGVRPMYCGSATASSV